MVRITLAIPRALARAGLALVLCSLLTAPARAGDTAAPLILREQWRAGGESDDIFFGSIGRVTCDAAGNVYVLDSQLSEVHIYSPAGEFQRTVGHEGDGPGEVRRPGDMFLDRQGRICLLQSFPGRIVSITSDGIPAGDTTYDAGGGQGQFGVLVGGRGHLDGMALAGIRMTFGGSSQSQQVYFLSLCDAAGKQRLALLEKEHVIDYANFELDEAAMDFVWSRFDVGPDGRVYAAPDRNAYRIVVFGPDGERERVIEHPYQPLDRNATQRDRARRIIEAVGANYPTPPRAITTEPTEADIAGLWALPDGKLWVLTSRGQTERPAGALAVLDEWSNAGQLARHVALMAPGDPETDQIFALPDGRIVVVAGALDAWLTQQGVAGEESGSDQSGGGESAPLELICYRVE